MRAGYPREVSTVGRRKKKNFGNHYSCMYLTATPTVVMLLSLTLIPTGMMYPHDSVCPSKDTSEEARRSEHVAILVSLAVILLLRVVYVFRYPIDSDEPQHLHVVWGWTQGLLQ